MSYKKVGENPLKYEDPETGANLPVRYYTDIGTGAVVAFLVNDNRAHIVQMRVVKLAGKPLADALALKAFLGTCKPKEPSAELTAADIARIEIGSNLTPKEVK